jgi:hypothetical protein
LGLRDQLHSSLEKDGKPDRRGGWHSRAYHRFFEGYSEIAVPNPNGKGTRIQFIYTGNYYRQDLTQRQRILLRMLYVVLFLGVTCLFVSSAILPLTSNSTWYVVLPEAVSVAFLFWILIVFLSYLPAELNMKIADYRSSSLSFIKATTGVTICLGITALATLIFIVLNPSDEPMRELLCSGMYIVGGLITLGMNRIEKKVNYIIIPCQDQTPDDGSEIK